MFPRVPSRSLAATVAVLSTLLSSQVNAGEAPFGAVLTCEPKSARGRVLCEVDIEALEGSLTWADIVVLSAPDFASPLKNRVSPREGKTLSDRRMRIQVAFLAKSEGRGRVTVQVRAVLCKEATPPASCTTAVRVESAELVVGPLGP